MRKLRIALAGNANVGKSAIFNYLTKLHQHLGNWPGKTVEKAEGTFRFRDYLIDVIDLPGIYSLSAYSIEELVTREYIAKEKPDVVVDVVDASVLERNLYLTLQLMEMELPLVVALNQTDIAEKKGIRTDQEALEKLLGVPVVETVAIKGTGIFGLVEKTIEVFEKSERPKRIPYGREIEETISRVEKVAGSAGGAYPPRWVALKLLEEDQEISGLVSGMDEKAAARVGSIAKSVEKMHHHSCATAVACERYAAIGEIVNKVQKPLKKKALSPAERLDRLITHKFWGYPVVLASLALMFVSIFVFGNFLSGLMEKALADFIGLLGSLLGTGFIAGVLISLVEGTIAAVTVVFPYVIPFYVVLGVLEDSGYLARIAFLMDRIMHSIGLHGKAFIPMILGYGCNVPACLGCRIMETQRERTIAIFVTTFVPCAAVTAVILGLVAKFVGIWWALALYVIDLCIIFLLGRIAFRVLPGEPTGLIMEIPSLRAPQLKTTFRQTWFRLKDFVFIAFPVMIASTVFIKIIQLAGLLGLVNDAISPVTVLWLGLPAVTGIAFIFGILRKELTLVMLAALLGTTNFAAVLSHVQMLVFAFVTMLYIPCAATIAVLIKEAGWKKALSITAFKIAFAILAGGILFRILSLFM